jgi:ABC-type multidrug transport system fused ATPase/permease subunit
MQRALQQLAHLEDSIQTSLADEELIFEIIDKPEAVLLKTIKRDAVFMHVTFNYTTTAPLLKDISANARYTYMNFSVNV